jgi:hypothetical protein
MSTRSRKPTKEHLQAEAERKQDLAWKLHTAGATPQEIAASKDPTTGDKLFKDARGAAQALRGARRRYESDDEDPAGLPEQIKDDLNRLSRLQRALWPAATGGDIAASREIRQIVKTRAEILGYAKIDSRPAGKADPVDEIAARREARRAAHG